MKWQEGAFATCAAAVIAAIAAAVILPSYNSAKRADMLTAEKAFSHSAFDVSLLVHTIFSAPRDRACAVRLLLACVRLPCVNLVCGSGAARRFSSVHGAFCPEWRIAAPRISEAFAGCAPHVRHGPRQYHF
jgi:hypothetical protein